MSDERGLTSVELLADVAVSALALVAIGTLLAWLGVDFVDEIREHLDAF